MHSDNGAKERPTQRAQEAHKLIQLRGPTSSAQALEAPYLLSIPSRPCLSYLSSDASWVCAGCPSAQKEATARDTCAGQRKTVSIRCIVRRPGST